MARRYLCILAIAATSAAQVATVRVDRTPGHAINSFDPDSASVTVLRGQIK